MRLNSVKTIMNKNRFIKIGMLAVAVIGTTLALISWIPNNKVAGSEFKQNPTWTPKGGSTIAELNAKVEEYYGDPDDVSEAGRARKMQALIMELTIKAKTRNPDFQVIPQDALEYAHIDGDTKNPYDWNLLNLLDGWGIEDFSATTVTRLANLSKVGIKGTANTNGETVKVVVDNQKIAADNNILWHPRLSAQVYQSPGIGNPGYTPIYSPSSNSYNIIHDPIPAGIASTLNSNNVTSMSDAKNYLYMISFDKYVNWPDWEAVLQRWLNKRLQNTGKNGTFFGWQKATHKMKAGRRILRNLQPQSGMFFILTHIIPTTVLLPGKRLKRLNGNLRVAGGWLSHI